MHKKFVIPSLYSSTVALLSAQVLQRGGKMNMIMKDAFGASCVLPVFPTDVIFYLRAWPRTDVCAPVPAQSAQFPLLPLHPVGVHDTRCVRKTACCL